ncbi:MAG: hypothetical protein KDJ37_03485 [Hyphomicrobiaceae bacterium]|nr:hypothetical protein [Hyphomicrobiaceae bacterium]
MGYRGQDLDLRTPQTWRASPGDFAGGMTGLPAGGGHALNGPRARHGYGSDEIPIWVDDTLLACCNHAFDVALAHRAAEVRLEHLVHALTRIEDAADVLDAAGIQSATLRRETATLIASEIPVAISNGSGTPPRADAFEEVLRIAAAHAYQRNAPATVEDLLYVFLEMRPQIAGIELMDRHIANVRRSRPVRNASPPLRQPSQPAFAPPPPPRDTPRERVRRPAGRFFVNDPQLPDQDDAVQRATDSLQNSRIEALEQMIRAISGQITGQRDDAQRFSGGVFDRLQMLETLMSSRPEGGDGGTLQRLIDRLDSLERLMREPRDGNTNAMQAQLDKIEHAVRDIRPASDLDLAAIDTRLGEVEARIEGTLAQKFAALDSRFDPGQMLSRLDIIEEALIGRDGALSGDLDSRIQGLSEAAALVQTSVEDARLTLSTEIGEISAGLQDHATRIAENADGIANLLRVIEGKRAEDQAEIADLRQRLVAYEAKIDNLMAQSSEVLAAYGEALSAHQQSVDGYAAQSSQAIAVHGDELRQVHEALVKLNVNQHTLAGSIDQWRSDGAGDLAIVADRIEGLEREAGRPMALLETLSENMEGMHRVTVERYHRRYRFWYWLFGTDDWVTASWPSQAARIEEERRALQSARRQGVDHH